MFAVTKITITDPELLAKIAAANGQIIFQGPTGEVVKTVETVAFGKLPPGMKSPFTDEEIEQARKQPGGLPLSEVWQRIYDRYGV